MIIERATMRALNTPHFRRSGLLLLLSLACVNLAFAGGYWIELENPAVSSDPKAQDAVLIVRATGCQTPANARLTATAEGSVEGEHQSLPLETLPLSTPGAYAIRQQWPTDGTWVLSIAATRPGEGRGFRLTVGALVPIGPELFPGDTDRIRPHALDPRETSIPGDVQFFFWREPTDEEISSSLNALAAQKHKLRARVE